MLDMDNSCSVSELIGGIHVLLFRRCFRWRFLSSVSLTGADNGDDDGDDNNWRGVSEIVGVVDDGWS
jgi:hypothetical protein